MNGVDGNVVSWPESFKFKRIELVFNLGLIPNAQFFPSVVKASSEPEAIRIDGERGSIRTPGVRPQWVGIGHTHFDNADRVRSWGGGGGGGADSLVV